MKEVNDVNSSDAIDISMEVNGITYQVGCLCNCLRILSTIIVDQQSHSSCADSCHCLRPKLKSYPQTSAICSRYYADACNEWRRSPPRLSAWQRCRNIAAVANRRRHCVRFDRPAHFGMVLQKNFC